METNPPAGFSADLASFNDSIDSVGQGTNEFIWHRHRGLFLGMIAITVVVTIPCWYLALFAFMHGLDMRGPLLLAVLPFIIPAVFYAAVSEKMEKIFFLQLSSAIGFTYRRYAPPSTAAGFLFKLGSEQGLLRDVLIGTYRTLPMRLFSYTFTTGSGRNQETHEYMVCELRIVGTLPELFVRDRSLLVEVNPQPPHTRPLTLEGDFNNRFQVYVAEGQEIEGLQVLEPDSMAKIMDGYAGYGFECSGDRLNVFTRRVPYTKEGYQKLVALADQLFDVLIPGLARVVEPVPTASVPATV